MTNRHNIWKSVRLLAVLALLLAALCGCSAEDVRLPGQVDLFTGQQFPLAAAVEIEGDPEAADVMAALASAEAQGVTLEFASSDPQVAAVDEVGIVEGVAPGRATVTVECAAFGYTAQVAVTVREPAGALQVVPALTMQTGETASLQPEVQNAQPEQLTYTVEDPSVAAVDAAGNVTALAEGRTVVTAALPGSSLTAACEVTVGEPAESIQLSRGQAQMQAGETLTLAAAVLPSADTPVEWQTSDPEVATVRAGIVTAHTAGTVTITAAAGRQTASCTLTVTGPATPESAVTAETAAPATAESATPETAAPAATAESATAESAAPIATAESAATETAAPIATAESAAAETIAPAATAESATPESATPESATPENAVPEAGKGDGTAGPAEETQPEGDQRPGWLRWLSDAWGGLFGG